MARTPIIAILVGALMGPLTFLLMLLFPPAVVGTVMPVITAVLAVALLWARLPPLAKEATLAEEEDGVLTLVHGDDNKVIPVAGYYWKKSNVVEPLSRLKFLKFVIDKGSTLPVAGQKSKLALAYVNYPFLLQPERILVAYDYRRLGFDNAAQLIDYVRNYENLEKMEEELSRWKEVYAAIENASSLSEVPENIREQLPVETDEEFLGFKERLAEYIADTEALIARLRRERPRPIVKVGSRVYSVRDVLGWLGFTVRPTKLASLVETARLEERYRLSGEWSQVIKYGVLVFMAVIGIIALIIVLNWLGHPVTVQQVPIPANATG